MERRGWLDFNGDIAVDGNVRRRLRDCLDQSEPASMHFEEAADKARSHVASSFRNGIENARIEGKSVESGPPAPCSQPFERWGKGRNDEVVAPVVDVIRQVGGCMFPDKTIAVALHLVELGIAERKD